MQDSFKHVLVLVGPTASGKTEVALHLAKLLNAEILSADSRQVYKHLDIGTAKPSADQLREVAHHFIDEKNPDEDFSAGEFGAEGRKRIEQIFARRKTPIVAGGSGLYLQSLVDGFFEGPGADREYRELLERKMREGMVGELLDELKRVDPASAQRADITKPRRIIRALEVYHLTGIPIAHHYEDRKVDIAFHPVMFGLNLERKKLYERINARCERMIAAGLVREAEELERRGYGSGLNALNTVGYAEVFSYRRGEITFEEMVRLFKRNSRRYAKRQLTWFRRDWRIHWIEMDESKNPKEVAGEIAGRFREAGSLR